MCPGARTQPGRIWQARYDLFMRGQKFTQSIVDCRVFYLRLSDGKFFVVGVYVDDNWIICDDDSTCDECYATWKPEFDESENVVQAADDFCGIRTEDLPCGAIALSSKKLLLALYEMIEEYRARSTSLATPMLPDSLLRMRDVGAQDLERACDRGPWTVCRARDAS